MLVHGACTVPPTKTSATYVATFDLEWVHTFGAARKSRAIQRFVQQPPASAWDQGLHQDLGCDEDADIEATAATAQDLWWSSLLWYQFPGGRGAPPLRGAHDSVAYELRKASVNQWRDAFSSLYYAMRHGDVPYFYLKSAQFTILWRGDPAELPVSATDTEPATNTDTEPATPERWRRIRPFALVSSSTRDFRQKLREAQVEFSLPNNTSSTVQSADQREEEIQRELKAMEKSNPGVTRTKPAKVDDGNPDSLICVEGHVDIGGLYEVILCMAERALALGWGTTGGGLGGAAGAGRETSSAASSSSAAATTAVVALSGGSGAADSSYGGAHEAPCLLARSPFLHATLETLKIQFAGSVMAAHGDKSTVHQQLELTSGYLLPCAVQQQCEALAMLGKARHHTSQKPRETSAGPHFFARLAMDESTAELCEHPEWATSRGSSAIDEASFSVDQAAGGGWKDKFELTSTAPRQR